MSDNGGDWGVGTPVQKVRPPEFLEPYYKGDSLWNRLRRQPRLKA